MSARLAEKHPHTRRAPPMGGLACSRREGEPTCCVRLADRYSDPSALIMNACCVRLADQAANNTTAFGVPSSSASSRRTHRSHLPPAGTSPSRPLSASPPRSRDSRRVSESPKRQGWGSWLGGGSVEERRGARRERASPPVRSLSPSHSRASTGFPHARSLGSSEQWDGGEGRRGRGRGRSEANPPVVQYGNYLSSAAASPGRISKVCGNVGTWVCGV